MAYDEALAQRVREAIGGRPDVSERKMFDGLCFMCRGNMFLGVMDQKIMARVGSEAHDEALSQPGASVMDFTGRPMKGYVYVGAESIATHGALQSWIDQTYSFAEAMPAKAPRTTKSTFPRKTRK